MGLTFFLKANGEEYHSNILAYALLFLIAFLVLTPMIMPGVWPAGHEGANYALKLHNFRGAFLNGISYPRWMPDANGGYGYPTFLFYQPGFFFIAMPFSFLPYYPLSTMYATLFFLFFAGGIGAYKLCRELSDYATGLFCSILFILTPYLYVNLYIRGDLSELMAMLLSPWVLYFLIVLKKNVHNGYSTISSMAGIAMSLLVIIVSHPATAMFLLFTLLIIMLYISFDLSRNRKTFFIKAISSILFGLVLSSPYWLTVFQMKELVNLQFAFRDNYAAELNTVGFPYLFNRGSFFQIGLPHFVLATFGFLFGRKKKIIQASYLSYLIFILLMTPFAATIWKKIEIFSYVQFPWRLLSVTSLLQITSLSGLQDVISNRRAACLKSIILVVVIGITAMWYLDRFQISGDTINLYKELNAYEEYKLERFYTFTNVNEFLPKSASKHPLIIPRRDLPLLLSKPPAEFKELKGNSPHRLRYQITHRFSANITINQIYMPGWRVIVDQTDVSSAELEKMLAEDGRMQFSLPPGGQHTIEAFYEGPPGWRMRNAAIAAFSLGIIFFSFYDEKKRRKKCSR